MEKKGMINMSGLSFFFGLLCLISIDIGVGFIIFIFYRYFDMKYFSDLEINQLKEENKYLREENQKIKGSTDFWGK